MPFLLNNKLHISLRTVLSKKSLFGHYKKIKKDKLDA